MRLIIAGSRALKDVPNNYQLVKMILDDMVDNGLSINDLVIISGGAKGADNLGEQWAYERNIDVIPFIPVWKRPDGSVDKAAGFKRNAAMGQFADAAVVFWDGKSKGSEHMIKVMEDLGKPVSVIHYNEDGQFDNDEGEEQDE